MALICSALYWRFPENGCGEAFCPRRCRSAADRRFRNVAAALVIGTTGGSRDRDPDILDRAEVPFDAARTDRLMEEAGIDVLLATSKHDTATCSAATRFIFFSAMDAIGHSRYLPIVIYAKGRPDQAAYVGNRMERAEHENRPFWTPTLHVRRLGHARRRGAGGRAPEKIGQAGARIGIEPAFLPSDARRAADRAAGGRALRRCDRGASSGCGRSRRRASWRICARPRSGSPTRCWRPSPGRAKARPRRRSSSGCGARRPGAGSSSTTAC